MSDITVTMIDGTVYPVRLTYRDLYELERTGKWEEELDEFFRIRETGLKPKRKEMDALRVVYTGYLCANREKDSLMKYPEFIEGLDMFSNRGIVNAFALLNSKKK